MQSKSVPKTACQFIASVDVRTNGDSAKTAPITITALSGEPIEHWYWGNCVFDFAGMKLHKPRLALDYCHDEEEIIGYCGNFDSASGSLTCSGALVPYAANPEDMATEVIYKSQQGVPYEASIYFTNPVIEQVPEGMVTTVNGKQYMGISTVFREWTLRGVAICPYGQDSQTKAMALKDGSNVNIKFMEHNKMSQSIEQPEAAEVKAVEVAPVENTPVAEAEAVEAIETVEDAAIPEAAPVEATALSEGKKFLTAFGAIGGVWFAEGKSYEEANGLYLASLKSENETLKNELQKLSANLNESRGEALPVSGTVTTSDAKTEAMTKLSQNLPAGLAKFAAGIQIRK